VVPDIVLPSLNNYGEVGEDSLPNALPWDTIPSAKFEPLNLVQPFLAKLQERSIERVSKDRDYIYLRGEIERYQKTQAEKSLSLNEQERRKEKEEIQARQKARKKELRERPESDTKIYEVTLEQVDLPGLPPPLKKTNQVTSAESSVTPKTTNENVSVASSKESKITAAHSSAVDSGDDEDKTEPEPDEVDMALREAERILLDLIAFSTEKPVLMESVRFVR
jgi:carboxyl-terminal processing protease